MPAGRDAPDAFQPGEPGDKSGLVLGHPGEAGDLVLAHDDPPEIDAPDILVPFGKADLVVGDAHLHHPAVLCFPHFALPDTVPGGILGDVVGQGIIHDRPGRIDAEEITRPFIVIGVNGDHEPVRIEGCVAPPHPSGDLIRFGIVAERRNIQRLVIIGNPNVRFFRGRLAVIGIVLSESVDGITLPDGLVELAVDDDRGLGPNGRDNFLAGFGFGKGIPFFGGYKPKGQRKAYGKCGNFFHFKFLTPIYEIMTIGVAPIKPNTF